MIFRRLYHDPLAQASYLIACEATRLAVVIDPLRDAEPYLEAAREEDVRIAFVAETHVHADFLSGAEELSRLAHAQLLLSAEGVDEPGGALASERIARAGSTPLHHGETVMVGAIRLDVRHTPGHTPEHLTYVVTDTATSDLPMGAVTGDFLFVGDVGRPDLLERSLGVQDSMTSSAAALFHSLRELRDLPDYLQIWPGHGAGSACGKSLSAMPQSTLGYERSANWAFGPQDEASFTRLVLTDLPDPPAYFGRVKALNARGGLPALPRASAGEGSLREAVTNGALVVDTRPFDRFAAGHLESALSIPLGRGFLEWAGSVADPDRDMVLLAEPSKRALAEQAARDLALIGFDRVLGVLPIEDVRALASAPPRTIESIPAPTLVGERPRAVTVVDVRTEAEWRNGHVPGAVHVPLNVLVARVNELRGRGPLAVYCQSGSRSAVAVSALRAAGIPDVADVDGGFAEWQRSGGRAAETDR